MKIKRNNIMIKDLPEAQTHSENDGCGEPEHNSTYKNIRGLMCSDDGAERFEVGPSPRPQEDSEWETKLMMVDFRTAFRVIGKTKTANHHDKCSWKVSDGGFLCDCAAIEVIRLTREDLKSEIAALIISEREKAKEEMEKAYGGCRKCYGKGYATQMERYTGHGEADIGTGDIEIDRPADYYLPCSCDRGVQIAALIRSHTPPK